MINVVRLALLAVEVFRDLAAELDLVLVFLTEEARRIELEVIVEVEAFVIFFIDTARLKLLEPMIFRSRHQ